MIFCPVIISDFAFLFCFIEKKAYLPLVVTDYMITKRKLSGQSAERLIFYVFGGPDFQKGVGRCKRTGQFSANVLI
jgi:hypothetical protein